MSLNGKTAIVTGSSRGIGAGIALELGKRGANVVINYTSDSSQEKAENVKKEIEEAGGKATVVRADLSTTAEIPKIVEAALTLSPDGKINMVVHNAGYGPDMALAELTEEFYDLQMGVNFKSVVFLQKAVLPYLAENSRIVLMSSISARAGYPFSTVYAASKAALESVARVWARELGKMESCKGTVVNCVNPGPIDTDMWTTTAPEEPEVAAMYVSNPGPCPDSRLGQVSDIVPLVAFLCSEECRWCSGSVVNANGGLVFV